MNALSKSAPSHKDVVRLKQLLGPLDTELLNFVFREESLSQCLVSYFLEASSLTEKLLSRQRDGTLIFQANTLPNFIPTISELFLHLEALKSLSQVMGKGGCVPPVS